MELMALPEFTRLYQNLPEFKEASFKEASFKFFEKNKGRIRRRLFEDTEENKLDHTVGYTVIRNTDRISTEIMDIMEITLRSWSKLLRPS